GLTGTAWSARRCSSSSTMSTHTTPALPAQAPRSWTSPPTRTTATGAIGPVIRRATAGASTSSSRDVVRHQDGVDGIPVTAVVPTAETLPLEPERLVERDRGGV